MFPDAIPFYNADRSTVIGSENGHSYASLLEIRKQRTAGQASAVWDPHASDAEIRDLKRFLRTRVPTCVHAK